MSRPQPHVGIVASLAPATGNHALALRLESTFVKLGWRCSLFDVHDQDVTSQLARRADTDHIVAFVGIHLLRAGWPLAQQRRPFALVIGGTDVNEHVHKPELRERMGRAISAADRVVAMHPDLRTRFVELWPAHASKLVVIPAAVHLCVPLAPSAAPSFRLHDALRLPPAARVFLLPTNLRPVKDPLFLAAAFEAWHRTDRSVHLALVGPALDQDFAARVKAEVSPLSGVHHLDAVPAAAMQEAMQQAFAVVNSSRSEGLSTALLEAMALGRVVIARRNAGNVSLVKHEHTGLVFDTPEEFIAQAQRLLARPALCKRLTRRAQRWVMAHFDPSLERNAYKTLLARFTHQAKL